MYNQTIELIKQATEELQIMFLKNPTLLFKEDGKFKKKKLCLMLASKINNKIKEPWLTMEEIETIYKKPVWKDKTACKNVYYTNGDVRIYSSINHETFYIDDEYNMYISLCLGYQGDIDKYFNPYFEVKINLLAPITMLRLSDNKKYSINIEQHLNKIDDDKVRIKLYEE